MKKSFFALLMAVVLVFSGVVPGIEVQAEEQTSEAVNRSFETAQEWDGEDCEVSLNEGEEVYFKYTPQEDGVYIISSAGDSDTCGKLYSEDGNLLAENDDGDDLNFSINYFLKAGATYYLKAYIFGTGSFTVRAVPKQVEGFELYYNPNVSVTFGETAVLEVHALGVSGDVTYQWYRMQEDEDVKIDGATQSRYEVLVDKIEKNYQYYCEAIAGEDSQRADFSIQVDTGLIAVSDTGTDDDGEEGSSPARQITVEYGKTVELKVSASSGTGQLSYQWYRNPDAEEDTLIAGATGSSYELAGNADCAKEYCCWVSDGINRSVVWFYVTLDTGITADSDTGTDRYGEEGSSADRKVTVEYGKTIALKVNASGGVKGSTLSYQWYNTGKPSRDGKIDGATSNTYQLSGNGDCAERYCCEVSDGVTSKVVHFDIKLDTGLKAVSPTGTDMNDYGMTESSAERRVVVKYGGQMELKVDASGGAGELSYQWYDTNEEPIEGATGDKYMLAGTEEISGVEFSCRVTDGVISKYVYFRIALDTGLKAVSPTGTDRSGEEGSSDKREVNLEYGNQVTLEVTASSQIGECTYSWHRLRTEGVHTDEEIIAGAKGSSYTVVGTAGSEGEYVCRIWDGSNEVEVSFYVLMDTGLKVGSTTGIGDNGKKESSTSRIVAAKYKQKTPLEVTASGGAGQLTYQWYRGQYSYESSKIEGANTSRYEPVADAKGAVMYHCMVSDGAVDRGVWFYLDIDNGLKASSKSGTDSKGGKGSSAERNVTVSKNGNVVLKVDAVKGEDGKELTYQWNECLHESVEPIDGAVGNTFTLKGSDAATSTGLYSCEVRDGICWREVVFHITVGESIENCSISVDTKNTAYTGSAVKPKVTVKDGRKTLREGTDYTISYVNNVKIGKAKVLVTGKGKYVGTVEKTFSVTAKKGKIYTVKGCKYKVTGADQVAFAGVKNAKPSKADIPKAVNIGGKSFKVTSIAANALKKSKVKSITVGDNVKEIGNSAFEGCSKLTKVTLGKGVTKIGSNTFKGCKKLGTITVKSTKLTKVGKNALKGIKSNARIKVPAKKYKAYGKLFKGKGQGKKVKIVK